MPLVSSICWTPRLSDGAIVVSCPRRRPPKKGPVSAAGRAHTNVPQKPIYQLCSTYLHISPRANRFYDGPREERCGRLTAPGGPGR
jgi:hypothetical protein